MKLGKLIGILIPILIGVMGQAQTLQSHCHSDPRDFKIVRGMNVDKKFPIASVSKLVTSYWALSSKGANYNFLTVVHVTPVENNQFDLHLQGSRDPYFGQEKLHYMISKLNEKGITRIRNLTFDENLLYLRDLDIERDPLKERQAFPWKNYYVSQVGPLKTLKELQLGLVNTYSSSVTRLNKAGIKLLPKVSFDVKKIFHLRSSEYTTTRVTKSFALRSAPLYQMLKEMNRNSNNFAAVEIFKMLGGRDQFTAFIQQKLGMGKDSIDFYEGSGNRVENAPVYNLATCRALLVIFQDLTQVAQKNALDIDDIVSVIGEDGLVDSRYPYTNDANTNAGVAKTGTSGAAMTLGGMLNTKPHRMYFMYNVNPLQFTEERKRISRKMIGSEVRKLSNQYENFISELDYKKTMFASFDSNSFYEIPAPIALP